MSLVFNDPSNSNDWPAVKDLDMKEKAGEVVEGADGWFSYSELLPASAMVPGVRLRLKQATHSKLAK